MNIVVCMKQVIDLEQIRIKSDTREPVVDGLPTIFGEYEKSALEEAVRTKENFGGKITVIAIGSTKLKETIKEALAMGADEAIIITDPVLQSAHTAGSARILAKAIETVGEVDLILMGDSSADEYSGEIPPRVAEILDLPSLVAVREIKVEHYNDSEGATLQVVRDLGNVLETIEVNTPVVVGVTSELNTPRLAPLSAILKAGRKPLHEWGVEELNFDPEEIGSDPTPVKEISNLAPTQDRKGLIYEDPEEGIEEVTKALQLEGVIGS